MSINPLIKPNYDFSSFSIERLLDNSVTDFDLFLNLQNHFILYSGDGYRWQRSELTNLLGSGHEKFYVRTADLPKARMYEVISRLPEVDALEAPPQRLRTIEEIGAQFLQCLYEGELTPSCVVKAAALSDAIVDCITEDRTCIKALSGLAQHDYYIYFHSIRVATYSVAIALEMGLSDPNLLKPIALGGIFHDIGKKDISLDVLNKAGALTELEWKMMKSHPQKGFEGVKDSLLSHVSREIILHHHEKRNGAGYPHGLSNGNLLAEVQIATLADVFDALTSSRAYQMKRSRFEALDFIKNRLLKDEICPEAFKALIHCLAA